MNYEIIGIIATVFVLLSFIVNDIKRVRIINIIGAFLFIIYGLKIWSFQHLVTEWVTYNHSYLLFIQT